MSAPPYDNPFESGEYDNSDSLHRSGSQRSQGRRSSRYEYQYTKPLPGAPGQSHGQGFYSAGGFSGAHHQIHPDKGDLPPLPGESQEYGDSNIRTSQDGNSLASYGDSFNGHYKAPSQTSNWYEDVETTRLMRTHTQGSRVSMNSNKPLPDPLDVANPRNSSIYGTNYSAYRGVTPAPPPKDHFVMEQFEIEMPDDEERGRDNGRRRRRKRRTPSEEEARQKRKQRRHRARRYESRQTQNHPYFTWFMTTVHIAVFVAEIIKMGVLTGIPIQTQPSFNPMIGPSNYVLINMGARFTPCMMYIKGVTDDPTLLFPCPNSTTLETDKCTLEELCGMGMKQTPGSDGGSITSGGQWWRFITPIFMHAGIIHIGFNMLLQMTLGADIEKQIGIIRYFFIYFACGIGGFLFGGNYTPDGIASTGASGSLFGIIAIDLLDLLFNWSIFRNPVRILIIHIIEIIVSFVLGLLPGLDNFSHIGGFIVGVLLGIAILRSPLKVVDEGTSLFNQGMSSEEQARLRRRQLIQQEEDDKNHLLAVFPKSRDQFDRDIEAFKSRPRRWYMWFLVRLACLALVGVFFGLLSRDFRHGGGDCHWCKYLSCLPVNGWCDLGNITTGNN
ncbi:putative rhomboid protein [Yarrowia sp. B02]|nr:putative rhomboid protein [Yarrowia sp. B02]